MTNKALRSFLLFTCVFSASAAAQVGEAYVSFGQSLFRNNRLGRDGSTTYKINDGFRLGARLTLNTYRFFGHEFGYGYTRSKLGVEGAADEVSLTTQQGFYNFLAYAFPEGSTFRPFLAGGGHFTTFYPPGSSAGYGGGVTKFGINYGGGFKVKVSPIFAIRLDLRDYYTGKPFDLLDQNGRLHQVEVSGGVGIVF
ncbi:MAG: outer membrane beta-barrel protein [Bryobacteraceae bacterium]